MVTLNNIVGQAIECVSKTIEQESVVIMPGRGQVNVLNEIGSVIWTLADSNRNISEIVEMVCAQYNVSREQAEQDTLEFVEKMINKGMLVVIE